MDGLRTTNVWQRLGLVASVVWVLAAGSGRYFADTASGNHKVQFAYQACLAQRPAPPAGGCDAQMASAMHAWVTPGLWLLDALVVAFLPVALGWGLAIGGLRLVRWVASAPS